MHGELETYEHAQLLDRTAAKAAQLRAIRTIGTNYTSERRLPDVEAADQLVRFLTEQRPPKRWTWRWSIESADAAARRICQRLEITVDDNTISYLLLTPFRPNPLRRRVGGPVTGARADVETGGRITLRDTLTRFLRWPMDGSGILFLPKKYDEEELRITVVGDGFAFEVPVHPNKSQLAYDVAAAINWLAQPRPDVTRGTHSTGPHGAT